MADLTYVQHISPWNTKCDPQVTFSSFSWVVVVVDCLHVWGQARSNGNVWRSCRLFSRRASSTNQSLLSLWLDWSRHLYLSFFKQLVLLMLFYIWILSFWGGQLDALEVQVSALCLFLTLKINFQFTWYESAKTFSPRQVAALSPEYWSLWKVFSFKDTKVWEKKRDSAGKSLNF